MVPHNNTIIKPGNETGNALSRNIYKTYEQLIKLMKQDQFTHFLFGLQVLLQQRARLIWKLSLWINASLSTEC